MTTEAIDLGGLLRQVDTEGRLEPCSLREIVLGRGVLDRVADTVAGLLDETVDRARVSLLVDTTRITRQGEDVKVLVESLLAERFDVVRTTLDDGHDELHVVDDVIAAARDAVSGVDAVVALGGGTISDIAKLAAVPDASGRTPVLVSVQTAASVDGFTDDVSVLLRDGVKRTVPSRWPDVVVADDDTIAEAPAVMNRAGFGEMTSMLVAPADWCLAGLTGVDPGFHEGPIRLLAVVGEGIGDWSPGVRTGEPAAVAGLTRALALRGVATGVAGTTAVLSGVEHLISHMLDQHHAEHGLPMGLHGAQVGVGAVIAASAWELLHERLATRGASVDALALDAGAARALVDRTFGTLGADGRIADECWRDYSAKLATVGRQLDRITTVLDSWSEHEPRLRELARPSAEIAARLVAAGAPTSFGELDPVVDRSLGRWAVEGCALMRNRFTVVDLLTLLGWWGDADVDEVLDRAARAVSDARAADLGAPA